MDLIIGAGITGLSYALAKGDDDYIIIERDDNIGGYCKTIMRNGYVWDYSGHFFHFNDAIIKDIVIGGISESNLKVIDKHTCIRYNDRYIDYPFQKNIHQLSKGEFIDCLVDLFSIEKKSYTTFKEMLFGKFGRSIAEKFLIPYNEKLYACDLDKLDKDAMGRFFPYADREQIIRGFKSKDVSSYNSSFTYPKGGAVQYVNALASRLKRTNIRRRTEIIDIDVISKSVLLSDGATLKYDRLISTIPLPKLLDLAHIDYDKNIYSWNKVLVFNLGFDTKGPIEKFHWIYFPEKTFSFYRVGFYDNILEQSKSSLYVELGFDKDAVVCSDDWLEIVLRDLRRSGCIFSNQVLVDYESILMDPAYVHITESSIKDVQIHKQELELLDIYSIGRYGSWTYCSIEDNVKEAIALSSAIK